MSVLTSFCSGKCACGATFSAIKNLPKRSSYFREIFCENFQKWGCGGGAGLAGAGRGGVVAGPAPAARPIFEDFAKSCFFEENSN